MGLDDFILLVRDLRLGLKDAEVRHLFSHLAEDVAVQSSLLPLSVDEVEGEDEDEDADRDQRASSRSRSDSGEASSRPWASDESHRSASGDDAAAPFAPFVAPAVNVEQFLVRRSRRRLRSFVRCMWFDVVGCCVVRRGV